MDYVYLPVGSLVVLIALFKRELLVEKQTFLIILVVSIVLAIAGIVLHFTEGDPDSSNGALLAPLLSLGLYHLLRSFFFRWFKHEPRDTYLNWSPGLGADRIFNIIFFIGAFLLSLPLTLSRAAG